MHGYNIIIHEHQRKKIKKRIELNFKTELIKDFLGKESFAKIFRKELNLLVDHFYLNGIQFYGFTIDMLNLNLDSELSELELWQKVHYNVEHYISDIGTRIELVEFCYLSIELKDYIEKEYKKELPFLKGIIGVRTLIGENTFLDIEVKKVFRSIHDFNKIEINRLYNPKKIKAYWNYVINQNNFRFHRFTSYGDSYNYIDYYGEISDLEFIYSEDSKNPGFAFGLDEWRYNKTYQIRGINLKKPNKKTLIIFLLNLYFFNKKYKLYQNLIFQEIIDTKYSLNYVCNLEFFKNNSIQIFEDLKKIYPMHLQYINFLELIINDFNKVIDSIEDNNNFLHKIKFNLNAVEFKNGIFFYDEKKFFSFQKNRSELNKKMLGFNTFLYFNINYQSLKKYSYFDNYIGLSKYFHCDFYSSFFDYLYFFINNKKIKKFAHIFMFFFNNKKIR